MEVVAACTSFPSLHFSLSLLRAITPPTSSVSSSHRPYVGSVASIHVRRTAATGDSWFPSSNDLAGEKESVGREFRHIADALGRGPSAFEEDVAGDDSYGSKCCPATKAFMIRKMQSHSLRQGEHPFHEDTHASFCCLFYQIVSRTPALMLSFVILLANFAVHSVAAHRSATEDGRLPSSSPGKGGYIDMTRKTPSCSRAPAAPAGEDEALKDHGTLLRIVSPVTANMEASGEYTKVDAMYRAAVKGNPDNSLFLSNYAQFLYLLLHDHHRAEYYFKRAVEVKPADAEALSRYADFLWQAKKELEAAEEAYLEAIAAEPGNMSYAAQYAHFLWTTGGGDTCFPIDDSADDLA